MFKLDLFSTYHQYFKGKLGMARIRVKQGPAGDRIYIKNLSAVIFGEDVLSISSVTGRVCNAVKGHLAKPALCPQRLKVLKDLFIKRMREEDANVSEVEIALRCHKIRPAIAEKITPLLRYDKSKNRNVQVPKYL